MPQRILMPLDGSELAEQALRHAVARAKHYEADPSADPCALAERPGHGRSG